MVNQLAWSTFKDAEVSFSGVCEIIERVVVEMERLEEEIKVAEKSRDIKEADRLGEKHRILFHTKKKLIQEKSILFRQKESFRREMLLLGRKTKKLKLQIRDTCGSRGRDWYTALVEKTEYRKLARG